ncbi:ATP-binding cassette domain-containing protein [Streptomonospora salina]|uniref:ABC-type transport system involved in cytochrome bd biosynthesis fused ATPase/permease subunit n=1 Tax=Streptomonospora salina TaxID=104205 RepID=A0A841EC94_9ACTN|nr:ATP-binding cassette domain-containing protein [Streptomonospora salina]MBB6000765.1 ABC-type transport system involved in cytochrome bd biosynthesis fused ATPase/permease subunit [Streptomonospora salina]
MMIVGPLWREAARFPAALLSSAALLLLAFSTHLAQAAAIAWSMSAVLGGRPQDVLVALLLIFGIAVLRLLASLAQTAAAAGLGGRVRQAVRRRAMASALVPERLHDTAVRDGTVRASLGDGVDGTDAYVSKYIPAVVQVTVACPLVVALLALLSPWAAAGVAAAVLLAVFGPMAWKRMIARRQLDHWDSYEALSADVLESLRGMATLRTLGDVSGTRARLHARSEALRRATERVMRSGLAETAVTDLAVQGGIVAAAGVAVWGAVSGQPPAGEVYLVLLLGSEAFRPVRELSRHWHAGFLGLTAIRGLQDIGAFGPVRRGEAAGPAPEAADGDGADAPAPSAAVLRVSNLRFRYPGTASDVISGLDLTARRGELSAIIGPSGSGKSTLFDLLMGFLAPATGRLELDGRTLGTRDIAVVSQRPVLFAGTIRENLDVSGTAAGEADLVRACRAAGVLEEMRALTHGFDTEVAEAGASLSGGQRQRLALARALLAHRPVLLVDEPTSALDSDRAADVVETLHRVARDRIVIMITHRPEALADVPTVLRLDAGRLDRSVP